MAAWDAGGLDTEVPARIAVRKDANGDFPSEGSGETIREVGAAAD